MQKNFREDISDLTGKIDPIQNYNRSPYKKLIDAPLITSEHLEASPLATFLWLYRRILEQTVGQKQSCFNIALALTNHFLSQYRKDFSSLKVNPLILGPTGSGKTSTVRYGAELLRLPFVEFSLAHVTPAGIKGLKLNHALRKLIDKIECDFNKNLCESLLSKGVISERTYKLLEENDFDSKIEPAPQIFLEAKIFRAENGVIFLDEFDKKSLSKEVAGDFDMNDSIQNELLDYLGGGKVSLEEDSPLGDSLYKGKVFDTSKVMFFLAGTFTDLLKKKKDSFSLEDLRNYGGIKQELIGRIGVPIVFKSLSLKELFIIYTEVKREQTGKTIFDSTLEYIRHYFPQADIDKEAVSFIVEKAAKSDLGARYLVNISQYLANRIINYLYYTTDFLHPKKNHRLEKYKITVKTMKYLLEEDL